MHGVNVNVSRYKYSAIKVIYQYCEIDYDNMEIDWVTRDILYIFNYIWGQVLNVLIVLK